MITIENILNVESDEIKQLSVIELAWLQAQLTADIAERKAHTTDLQKKLDFIRNVVLPEIMDAEGIDGVTISGVGRVSLNPMLQVNVKKENRPALHEWLRANGHDDLITEQTNSSTLKAYVKEQMQHGVEIPEDIVNVHVFTQARITKG